MLNELNISHKPWFALANNIQRNELKKLVRTSGTEDIDVTSMSDDPHEVGSSNFMEYEVVPYIVAISMDLISPLGGYNNPKELARIENLAEKIKESGKISPIIVGLEPNGEFWVVEGQHRSRAFQLMGEKMIPAMVIVNTETSEHDNEEEKKDSDVEVEIPDPNQLKLFEGVRSYIRGFLMEDISAWADSVKDELGMQHFDLFERPNGDIKLMMIRVPKNTLHQGIGTKAMERLVDYADSKGSRITLTPALKDKNAGTTSRSRLVDFYKRFGFVENKGRKKDFTISDSMYRVPKKKVAINESFIENATDEVLDKISKSGTKNLNDLEKLILYTISGDKEKASRLSLMNMYMARNTFGNHEITVMVKDKNSKFYKKTGRLYPFVHYDKNDKGVVYCHVDFEGESEATSTLIAIYHLVPVSFGDGSDFIEMLRNRIRRFKGFGDEDSFF
jgi:hypothetical protein